MYWIIIIIIFKKGGTLEGEKGGGKECLVKTGKRSKNVSEKYHLNIMLY